MDQPNQRLLTIRDIARECGVKTHRAKYAVDQYEIEPRQRAGIIRLWSTDQLPLIQSALNRIAGRKAVAHA
jgi:hypothetical protein